MTSDDVQRTVGVLTLTRECVLAEDRPILLHNVLGDCDPCAPYADAMDVELFKFEEGRVVILGKPSARYLNPVGKVQSGWAATILDGAMAHSVHTTLKKGEDCTTLEMKISHIRPVLKSSGKVRCESKLIHRGARTATSEGRLLDEDGNLLAHGSETCMISPAGSA